MEQVMRIVSHGMHMHAYCMHEFTKTRTWKNLEKSTGIDRDVVVGVTSIQVFSSACKIPASDKIFTAAGRSWHRMPQFLRKKLERRNRRNGTSRAGEILLLCSYGRVMVRGSIYRKRMT